MKVHPHSSARLVELCLQLEGDWRSEHLAVEAFLEVAGRLAYRLHPTSPRDTEKAYSGDDERRDDHRGRVRERKGRAEAKRKQAARKEGSTVAATNPGRQGQGERRI